MAENYNVAICRVTSKGWQLIGLARGKKTWHITGKSSEGPRFYLVTKGTAGSEEEAKSACIEAAERELKVSKENIKVVKPQRASKKVTGPAQLKRLGLVHIIENAPFSTRAVKKATKRLPIALVAKLVMNAGRKVRVSWKSYA